MHAMNVKRLGAVVSAVLLSAGFAGCGGGSSTGPGDDWQPASWTAAVGVTTGQPGSVKIIAERLTPAHDIYPCYNTAELCFNFGEWGELSNAWYPDEEPRFERLCPSSDLPTSDWKFTYEIHEYADCHGDVLNDENNPYNLVCFDAGALTDRNRDENFTIETLEIGENDNSVLCLSRNSNKDWDFTVCEDLTPEQELMDQHCGPDDPDVVLDCGCFDPNEMSVLSGRGRGPKKNPLCYIFPWLHFCGDDNGGGHGGYGGGDNGHGGDNGEGGYGGSEPPTEPSCVCDFDVDSLPEGCAPNPNAGCLITCGGDAS